MFDDPGQNKHSESVQSNGAGGRGIDDSETNSNLLTHQKQQKSIENTIAAAGDAKMKRYLIKIFEKMQQSNNSTNNNNQPDSPQGGDPLTEHSNSV